MLKTVGNMNALQEFSVTTTLHGTLINTREQTTHTCGYVDASLWAAVFSKLRPTLLVGERMPTRLPR